jgi:hypothetical protein
MNCDTKSEETLAQNFNVFENLVVLSVLDEMQDKIFLLDQIDTDYEFGRETSGNSEFEFAPMGTFKKLEID